MRRLASRDKKIWFWKKILWTSNSSPSQVLKSLSGRNRIHSAFYKTSNGRIKIIWRDISPRILKKLVVACKCKLGQMMRQKEFPLKNGSPLLDYQIEIPRTLLRCIGDLSSRFLNNNKLSCFPFFSRIIWPLKEVEN